LNICGYQGAAELSESISKLVNITILNLDLRYYLVLILFYLLFSKRNNNCGDLGVAKLGDGISKLVNITNLNLDLR
jgi:hypothetical protein